MSTANARVALVTGANRGLGLETCRQLLGRGMRVVMTGRDEDATERARRGLDLAAGSAIVVRMDVTDRASIEAAHRVAVKRYGAVDVLVNNAAVLFSESTAVLSIPADELLRTFETNLFGVIEVCRLFVPPMAANGYGRIVNVSSGAGQLASMSTYAPAYSISKAALNAFTRILAQTYSSRGVLANAVDPGWVRTDMGGPAAPRSVEQGVDTTVWLATLPDNGPTGRFFRDRRPIEW
ncbi:MAG: SDR family NAD(P)-dependent oxidoreductase [Luteitalea sp.]|nr:SDR family NAD(P)-dependent oxidoreductase [Luteitalea sp.]